MTVLWVSLKGSLPDVSIPRRSTEPFPPPWVLNQMLLWGEGDPPGGRGALGNVGHGDKEACVGQWLRWAGIL